MSYGPEFQKKFESIKVGAPKTQVLQVLGEPTQQEESRLRYYETRAPQAGEQLRVFVVHLKDDKVKKLEILPGPSATGGPRLK